MMKRLTAAGVIAIAFLSLSPAAAQQSAAAIHKLAFMQGTWRCVRHGYSAVYAPVYYLNYSFSPDGRWMLERSVGTSQSVKDWEVQMWGYDVVRKHLTAYRFTRGGVVTKTVAGWQNGVFVSKRDDNGATVTIRQHSSRAFDWVIQSADKSSTVTEACSR